MTIEGRGTMRILVTGATGKQGSRVARHLARRGHHVRAFTRDAGSPAARELARLGAEVATGDFAKPETVERAAQGVDAVLVVTPGMAVSSQEEIRDGRAIADAARAANVRHLVFSSVAGTAQPTGVPHFDSKRAIEEHARGLGLRMTVVAPVFFMENILSPWVLPQIQNGCLALPLPPERRLQMIALEDLAAFLTLALERPGDFEGRRFDIASDELPIGQIATLIGDHLGREIRYERAPIESLRAQSSDAAKMWEYFDTAGFRADVAGLRRDFPEVGWHLFAEWLRSQDIGLFNRPAAYALEAAQIGEVT